MRIRTPMFGLGLAAFVVAGGCARLGEGGAPGGGAVGGIDVPASADASATDGGADSLAASLALALSEHGHGPMWPTPAPLPTSPELRDALAAHLASSSSSNGASLAGAVRSQRLANETRAVDRNGDGSVLDDLVADELARLSAAAGLAPAALFEPTLFNWTRGDARLVESTSAPPAVAPIFPALRTRRGLGHGEVDLRHVGESLTALALMAAELLTDTRGELLGADPTSGLRGAIWLQRALAIEESLLGSLFHDGAALRGVDPADYDARLAPRLVPRRVRMTGADASSPTAHEFRAIDPASDLWANAALLRGATNLAWMAASQNPRPGLVRAFRGQPFDTRDTGPPPPRVPNYLEDVSPILMARCEGCHSPLSPIAGLDLTSFAGLMAGSSSGIPLVVPGDHAASPLWIILNGPWMRPGRTVPQMPYFEQSLPPAQIAAITAWIDAGAEPLPVVLPRPSDVGAGLARVLFRNLRDVHAAESASSPDALGLHDRVARLQLGNGEVVVDASSLLLPESTGLALSALAQFVAVPLDEPGAVDVLRRVAEGALRWLVTDDDLVRAGYDLAGETALDDGAHAELLGHATLTLGLYAAARVLGDFELLRTARRLADTMLADFFVTVPTTGGGTRTLLRARRAALGTRLDTTTTARLIEALLEAVADGAVLAAPAALEHTLELVRTSFVREPGEVIAWWPATVELGELSPADRRVPITWSSHVLPLFAVHCSGCHVAGAAQGDFRVDTPELIRRGGAAARTDLLLPGDPAASMLYQKLALRPTPYGEQMPLLRTPLAPASLAIVEAWIRAGAVTR